MICEDCKKKLKDDEALKIETTYKLKTDPLDQEFHKEFYLCNECFVKGLQNIANKNNFST